MNCFKCDRMLIVAELSNKFVLNDGREVKLCDVCYDAYFNGELVVE